MDAIAMERAPESSLKAFLESVSKQKETTQK